MPSLNELPFEVLEMILQSCFEKPEESTTNTFCSLARCSPRLRQAAEKALYDTSLLSFRMPKFFQFLRTMLCRPELVRQIKHVELLPASIGPELRDPYNIDKNMEYDVTHFLNSVHKQNMPYIRQWIHDIKHGQFDSIVALALMILHGLESLALSQPLFFNLHDYLKFEYVNTILATAVMQEQEQIRGPRQILQKLRSFGMAFYEDKQADTRGLRYLIAFCQLKSVKQLIVSVQYDVVRISVPTHLNFSTSISSLERIAFPYLPIGDYSSPQWVYRFIRCFPYLHSLSYVHHPAVMPSRRLELLVRAAAHLKSHLRELHLPPSVCCFCPYGHMRKIESLAHFEQLKIINVTAFDLWVLLPPRELASVLQPNSSVVVPLVRLLPCSLEELILQEGNTNTILHVWGLLEDLKAEHSRVPLLKYIRIIKSQHLIIREHWKTISYLKDLALKHNIILTVETRREAGLPPLPKWLPEYDCRDEYHLQQVNTILQEYLDQR